MSQETSGLERRESLFDGFEIGRGGSFLRVENRLSNIHFVDYGFSRRTADFGQLGTASLLGPEDRSRPWNQGLGGVGLAQNVRVGRKTFGKGTKERWLRS